MKVHFIILQRYGFERFFQEEKVNLHQNAMHSVSIAFVS